MNCFQKLFQLFFLFWLRDWFEWIGFWPFDNQIYILILNLDTGFKIWRKLHFFTLVSNTFQENWGFWRNFGLGFLVWFRFHEKKILFADCGRRRAAHWSGLGDRQAKWRNCHRCIGPEHSQQSFQINFSKKSRPFVKCRHLLFYIRILFSWVFFISFINLLLYSFWRIKIFTNYILDSFEINLNNEIKKKIGQMKSWLCIQLHWPRRKNITK